MSPFSIYIFKGSIFQPAILVFSGKSSPWCFFPVSLLSPPPHSGENWNRKEGLDLHGVPLDHQLTSPEGCPTLNGGWYMVHLKKSTPGSLEIFELGNHPFFRCKMLNFRGGIQRFGGSYMEDWILRCFCLADKKEREGWNVDTNLSCFSWKDVLGKPVPFSQWLLWCLLCMCHPITNDPERKA